LTGPGLSLPSRGQSGCLSLFRSLDESSGPSLHAVLPRFIGTVATSDSLPGLVAALSGLPLIRFSTGRSRLRRTEQGLSGKPDALSLRATVLYTVPASRIPSR
jgi:hypothetical protein